MPAALQIARQDSSQRLRYQAAVEVKVDRAEGRPGRAIA
jgi:hypothetical protein